MRIWPWAMGIGLYSATLKAIPTVVPDPIPCFLYLETHFFTESIVSQALSLYNIRQELWVPINAYLQTKSFEVPARMKQRTAYMVPNPIEYPMQRSIAAKILKEVLFEVFLEAMREYHANEMPNAAFVFDYIFTQQLPNFIKCFGPEVQELKPSFD
jgi:hypothetical protein